MHLPLPKWPNLLKKVFSYKAMWGKQEKYCLHFTGEVTKAADGIKWTGTSAFWLYNKVQFLFYNSI